MRVRIRVTLSRGFDDDTGPGDLSSSIADIVVGRILSRSAPSALQGVT